MAHNLNVVNGKVSFAATLEKGKKAWHGLGQYVDSAMTAEEAIRLAGLDYEVKPFTLFAHDEGKAISEVENHVGLLRTDTKDVLGVVSKRYGIVQNKECFSFLDSIIDAGEAVYETAGALGKGERIFLTAKLPNDIIIKGDNIENYFLLTNGHGNGCALQAMLTPIRVVCNNTLNVALKSNSNKITIRHTSNAQDRLREGARLMGLSSKYTQEISGVFDAMAEVKITDKQLYKFIEDVLNPANRYTKYEKKDEQSAKLKNNIDKVFEFARTHDTQMTEATKGTLYGAFNAITGSGWTKEYKDAEARFKDDMFGTTSKQVQFAFDKAIAMLN